jgi:hypothetical protein
MLTCMNKKNNGLLLDCNCVPFSSRVICSMFSSILILIVVLRRNQSYVQISACIMNRVSEVLKSSSIRTLRLCFEELRCCLVDEM